MKYTIFFLAVLLSGCSSLASKFENVPACALTHDRAFVLSMYGPFGLSSEISERYVGAMCPLVGYPQPAAKPTR